jgi:hypothetical protein
MKLTKLSAAWLPDWTCRLMPAPVDGLDAGTASQLIPGVRWTRGERDTMASMAQRHAAWPLRIAAGAWLVLVAGSSAPATAAEVGPAQLIGVWRGTSTCTDLVAAPACQNETVVYEFTSGAQPGAVRWVADKLVAGQRQRMGEMELRYDKAATCWKTIFTSPRDTEARPAQGMRRATEQGDEADEAFGGTRAR